jgi:2-methylisocitrate lyase-like PEP mutase family enzyme
VYDGLSARIAQQTGFPAVALSGNAVSGSLLAAPDVGLLSMWEAIEHAGRIARGLDIPLITDADTGYGGPLNVVRTVRELEAAGVAGMYMEDQTTPKRCGLLPTGVEVIDLPEARAKIRAAVDARSNEDFVIIARTDAKSKHGLEEAALRSRAYIEAGADAALVIGANTLEHLQYLADVVKGPLVIVVDETPPATELTDEMLKSVGCVMAMHTGVARYAVVKALETAFSALHRDRSTKDARHLMASFKEYNAALGLDDWLALESKYSTD